MYTSFYTLIRAWEGYAAVIEPGNVGKVKSYTKLQFARSARTQADPAWCFRILETLIYGDGVIETRWVADE